MSSKVIFPQRCPLPSHYLPLTLMSLDDWVLIMLHGADSLKCLQCQLTCDVFSLDINRFSFAAHCDATGKMLSNMCVFYHMESIAFIERRSICDSQSTALKKHAIFDNTTIYVDNKTVLLGIAGFQAPAVLSSLFANIPDVCEPVKHYPDTTMLYFNLPKPRFLLVTTPAMRENLIKQLEGKTKLNNSLQWLALDIEAGYPIIDSANSAKFIPQAANIQALDGISFHKGCYIGQEMVARAQYLGINKRALYWLVGKAYQLPHAGDYLELKVGKNWQRNGTVLAACRLENSSVWIQAILNNDLVADSILRVRNDYTGALAAWPLPYGIRTT